MKDLSLLERLRQNSTDGRIPFHMPGHKRNTARFPYLQNLSAAEDITEIDGFDNLHGAQEILADAMSRAAALWHSEHAYFLVNGSSCGILAGIRALTKRGDTVLLSRNAHKSVYHAIELCGLKPVFLMPPYDCARGMFLSLPPEEVRAALEAHPEVRLVILTSPTYEGVLSDTAAIAGIAHMKGIPLLVDGAHGAHLGLSADFPRSAVQDGADIVICSLHKTLPSLTQTAILHAGGMYVDQARLAHQLAVFETSSPSYLFLASMDGCVRALEDGAVMADWSARLRAFDVALGEGEHLQIPYHGNMAQNIPGVFAYDPSKIFVAGTDGAALADYLRQQGIEPEMVTPTGVLLMSGAGDSPEMLVSLARVIREADKVLPSCTASEMPFFADTPETHLPPEEALEMRWEFVPPEHAGGRVAAEYLWAYPPGIPCLLPGERIPADFSSHIGGIDWHSTRGKMPAQIAVLTE